MIASILPVPTFSCSGEHTMFGPGEYVLDPTEGIVDIEDLPRPQLVAYSRNHEHTLCPRCDHLAYRHKCGQRTLHDLLSPTPKNGMKLADQRSHFSFKMDSLHRLQAQCLHR